MGSANTAAPRPVDAALSERGRAPRRKWLAAVLDDIDQGTCSVLAVT